MNLGALRTDIGDALGGLDADWIVHDAPVDALSPPAFVLVWSDPWLLPLTSCYARAALDVLVVSARMEPEANYSTLESMVAAATVALTDAGYPPLQTGAPGPLDVAQITYLAARMLIRHPVTLGGS